MKKKMLFMLLLHLAIITAALAQNIAINDNGAQPDTSAMLDVSSVTRGFLIPRMAKSQKNSIPLPAAGLLVYQTGPDSIGFHYYDGSSWVMINNSSFNTSWNLNGNTGTSSANFIGTTDAQPIRFKIKGASAGIIDSANSLVAIGLGAMRRNVASKNNVAIGTAALYTGGNYAGTITAPNKNVAVGDSALFNNGSSEFGGFAGELPDMNTAVGYKSLFTNGMGSFNCALGANALLQNTFGANNCAVGTSALLKNTSGNANVAVGNYALMANTTADGNVAVGFGALENNTTGLYNIAIGFDALSNNTTGFDNIAAGVQSLSSNRTGHYNIGIGAGTLRANNSGDNNIAIGGGSLINSSYGYGNIGIGTDALSTNQLGYHNVATGDSSLYNNSQFNNTAYGSKALYTDAAGNSNTAIGFESAKLISGFSNTALGAFAQFSTSGNFNTAIGYAAYKSAATLNNWTAIGYNTGAAFSISNSVELGNTSVTKIWGQVNTSIFSDRRIKDNIQENVPGLTFITQLKPVTYNLNIHRQNQMSFDKDKPDTANWEGKYDIEKIKFSGFIAQDVVAAADNVGYNFSGVTKPVDANGLYGLRYAEFVVPLVKAVQEQQATIDSLKAAIKNLKEEQAVKIESLEQRMRALEVK